MSHADRNMGYASVKPKLHLKPSKSKPKRWSHQDDLQSMKGHEIVILTLDGDEMFGRLIETDQFTLKIITNEFESASNAPVIIFKHAIGGVALAVKGVA